MFGKVAQISCIYTYKDVMIDIRKIANLVGKLRLRKPDELKYEQIMDKISNHYWETAAKYLGKPAPEIKECYIVF